MATSNVNLFLCCIQPLKVRALPPHLDVDSEPYETNKRKEHKMCRGGAEEEEEAKNDRKTKEVPGKQTQISVPAPGLYIRAIQRLSLL